MSTKLSLFDLHCDTAHKMFKSNQGLYDNLLAVSVKKASCFEKYVQVAAIWSESSLSDGEAYERFFKILDHLKREALSIDSVKFFNEQQRSEITLLLSLEDARILEGDISRLSVLHNAGVSMIIPFWEGVNCLGGAFDTQVGLSPFGRDVIKECIKLGIIPDISHASRESADEIFDLCDGLIPVIASHSDSYSVCDHPRNLLDKQFENIVKSNGLVGINLYKKHLGINENEPSLRTVMRHIEHYLSLGGENTVCFGCDFDGAQTPEDIADVSAVYSIANEMARNNYSEGLIKKIFFENGINFIYKYLIPERTKK